MESIAKILELFMKDKALLWAIRISTWAATILGILYGSLYVFHYAAQIFG